MLTDLDFWYRYLTVDFVARGMSAAAGEAGEMGGFEWFRALLTAYPERFEHVRLKLAHALAELLGGVKPCFEDHGEPLFLVSDLEQAGIDVPAEDVEIVHASELLEAVCQ